MKVKNSKSYVEEAIKIHGNKYGYKFVEYKNNKTKIKIICQKHGEFFQRADAHLSGQGCIKCRNEKYQMQQEQFLFKAKEIHENKYDYTAAVYKNNYTKIKIICPQHGEFYQLPGNHIKGQGCRLCSNEKLSTKFSISLEQFILRSKAIHDNKYDYSLSVYKNNRTKIKIICPQHGYFFQTPNCHLRHGCHKCGGTKKLTQCEFLSAAKKKHNNRYDYTLVSYVNISTKIIIICKLHGEFSQTPNRHLQGDGCPKCNMSKGELKIKEYLDKNKFYYEQQFKFDSCANKRKLPFDFLVRVNSSIYLIEYNGQQHYELVNFTKNLLRAKAKFEKTKHHDAVKRKWCEVNSIPLLVIPYFNEAKIEKILASFLRKR
jgi:hypothetical protein